jgi:hypothetical protein
VDIGKIKIENNLSETAYEIKRNDRDNRNDRMDRRRYRD